jgi:hypothetical protein
MLATHSTTESQPHPLSILKLQMKTKYQRMPGASGGSKPVLANSETLT